MLLNKLVLMLLKAKTKNKKPTLHKHSGSKKLLIPQVIFNPVSFSKT